MRDIITQEEVANYFFEQGFDCSQVVLASFLKYLLPLEAVYGMVRSAVA